MFCEKCGREIPEDSAFCAYCGVAIPQEAQEEDWEAAARRREARLPSVNPGVTGKYRSPRRASTRHSVPGCVVPGAPKKKCAVCERELPASTVGDYCALCEMRRSRQQEAQERKAAEARFAREVAEGKRDRYDVSDEFDWDTLKSAPAASRAPKTGGWNADEEPKKKRKKRGWLAAVIVFVVVLGLLPNVLGILYGVVEHFTDGWGSSIGSAIPEPMSDAPDYPMESETENVSLESGEYEEWIEPMLNWTLNNYMPYTSENLIYRGLDRESVYWWTDGVINYVSGLGTAENDDGDETFFSYSTAFVMLGNVPGESGYVLQIEINGETLFDDTETVDSEGRITQAGGGAYDQEVGEYPFDQIPKYLTGKDGSI